jgi:AraC family transcriptional regulator, positive regulator of tynA and feaB
MIGWRRTIVNSKDSTNIQNLGFEEVQSRLQSYVAAQIRVERDDLQAFRGWARPLSVCGLPGIDIRGTSVSRIERTERHVRLEGRDDYRVILVLADRLGVSQNERVADLTCGDLTLVESARPVDFFPRGYARSLSFRLPRQMVISNFGYEPRGAVASHGTLSGKLIFQLAAEVLSGENPGSTQNDNYMRLAICDLLCAIFARPDDDAQSSSRHTAKLFARVRRIVRDSFANPDLTPAQVAAATGISLRYLQKLFTPRGTTCSHFIHEMRLDYAARLLHRRALQNERLPLSEIAFASGFRDYRR